MTAVAFDSYRIVKRLRGAGFTEDQAEAVTTAIQDSTTLDLSNLAGKDQLAALEAKMATQLVALNTKVDLTAARLEERIDRRGAESDARMVRWVVGTGIAAVLSLGGVLAGATTLILHALPATH